MVWVFTHGKSTVGNNWFTCAFHMKGLDRASAVSAAPCARRRAVKESAACVPVRPAGVTDNHIHVVVESTLDRVFVSGTLGFAAPFTGFVLVHAGDACVDSSNVQSHVNIVLLARGPVDGVPSNSASTAALQDEHPVIRDVNHA